MSAAPPAHVFVCFAFLASHVSDTVTGRINSGYFVEYLLHRPDVKNAWEKFVYHPFVMALGDGTLPMESFKGYIIQDYLYLASPLPRACPPSPATPLLSNVTHSKLYYPADRLPRDGLL